MTDCQLCDDLDALPEDMVLVQVNGEAWTEPLSERPDLLVSASL